MSGGIIFSFNNAVNVKLIKKELSLNEVIVQIQFSVHI